MRWDWFGGYEGLLARKCALEKLVAFRMALSLHWKAGCAYLGLGRGGLETSPASALATTVRTPGV